MSPFSYEQLQLVASQSVPAPIIDIPRVPPVLDWGVMGAIAVVCGRHLWDYFKATETNDRQERDMILKAVIERNVLLSDHLIKVNESLVAELVSIKK